MHDGLHSEQHLHVSYTEPPQGDMRSVQGHLGCADGGGASGASRVKSPFL